MILPSTNNSPSLSQCLLVLGAALLVRLNSPRTVSSLWEEVKEKGEIKTYEKYILALDFLYLLGLIDFEDGVLNKIKQDNFG